MKYTIRELEAFSVIGQEAELTNYQKRKELVEFRFVQRHCRMYVDEGGVGKSTDFLKHPCLLMMNNNDFIPDIRT